MAKFIGSVSIGDIFFSSNISNMAFWLILLIQTINTTNILKFTVYITVFVILNLHLHRNSPLDIFIAQYHSYQNVLSVQLKCPL